MSEIEPKIILMNPDGSSVEVNPSTKVGATDLLSGIRTTLAAGIDGGLLETNPFIIPQASQAEVSLPVFDQPTGEHVKIAGAANSTNRQRTLELATTAYLEKLQDPQCLHDFTQAHWDYHGIELMGLSKKDTRVDSVPYSENEIWQFMKLETPEEGNPGADLGYFHLPVLASADEKTRLLIGKGFPYMDSWVFQEGYSIKNGHQVVGWMRVDASLDAPFRTNKKGELTGLNEVELKQAIKDAKRTGQTINIYGSSGDVIKKIFRYFPDQGSTYSRLSESSEGGRMLSARFGGSGGLYVRSALGRGDRDWDVGGRSFLGVNKA